MDTNKAQSALSKPFGSQVVETIAIAHFSHEHWSEPELLPLQAFSIRPDAHVLHYASTCFEGLKAHVWQDGSLHLFRMADHLRRLQQSARGLCLPEPPLDLAKKAITLLLDACDSWKPPPGKALYLRPTLVGTTPGIAGAGKAPDQASFYVLAAPVGDYFGEGYRALRLALEQNRPRCTPGFGALKAGSNYAACLPVLKRAQKAHGVDQVLFAQNGMIEETGASNFFLANEDGLFTKALNDNFLHGITRDSVIKMAKHMGIPVFETEIKVQDFLRQLEKSEAFLTGTSYSIAGVGEIWVTDRAHPLRDGSVGPMTKKLRHALIAIQRGEAQDPEGWMTSLSR